MEAAIHKQNRILETKDLNVFYRDYHGGGGRKKQVLYDVSCHIDRGEVLGLVGESGSGKSSLAKAIIGINKNYNGEIKLDGKAAMVFQDPYGSLNPAYKVSWLLQEPLRVQGGYSRDEMKAKAAEMLELVGLGPRYADRLPSQLSGGQRQRVCIGIALMQEPELLIADEPVSALDVTIQAQILKLLDELREKLGISILFISHDLRVVYNVCSRVMIMKNGRVVEEGSCDKVYFTPENGYTKALLRSAGI